MNANNGVAIGHVAEMRAEVERLRAERQWQPIETAPRDGSPLCSETLRVYREPPATGAEGGA